MREINLDHVGFYSDGSQRKPAYEPGCVPCLVCGESWTEATVRTINVCPIGGHQSYFYRIHQSCDPGDTTVDDAVLLAVGAWKARH